MISIQDFSGYNPTWCPGCGNWGIGAALKSALVQLGFTPSSVFMVFGIGCSGNMNDFLNAYAMHSLHGRGIPNAIGIKLANHKFPVIANLGDGDCYGEGGNHFVHACRGNFDITVIVHNNRVYGLTTGQVSPTAEKGKKSKSTPQGIIEESFKPLEIAIVQGASFVAQAFAGDVPHLIETIKKAIQHKGFSLVNVLQPCVTFDKINTYNYYRERVVKLGKDFPLQDKKKALQFILENREKERYPIGVIYEVNKPTYESQLKQLEDKSLVEKRRFLDYKSLFKQFK